MALSSSGANDGGSSCTDPNCSQCKEIKRMKDMEKFKGMELYCNRCSAPVKVGNDQWYVNCQSCNQIVGTEMKALQNSLHKTKEELSLAKSTNEALGLKAQQAANDAAMLEKAYQEEAPKFLKAKADLFQAKSATHIWKTIYDHSTLGCIYCKNGTCMTMANLKQQAAAETPEWKCEPCEEQVAASAFLRKAAEDMKPYMKHFQNCGECRNCKDGVILYKEAEASWRSSMGTLEGKAAANRLRSGITDLSFLGAGAAILFDGEEYILVKLDMQRFRMMDLNVQGHGETPYAAIKSYQEGKLQVHSPAPSM